MQDQEIGLQLTWLQERALEDAYDSRKKKLWLAYLLAVPFGCLGAHRFYLNRKRSAFPMLGIWFVGFVIAATVVLTRPSFGKIFLWDAAAGLLMLSAWLWELLDFFLLPGMLRSYNARLESEIRFKLLTGQNL